METQRKDIKNLLYSRILMTTEPNNVELRENVTGIQFISSLSLSLSLSLHFNGHFSGEPGLASFIEAKDDGSGGDNWSYKTWKVSVKSSSPTNQHPVFYGLDALPVAQPTVSEH